MQIPPPLPTQVPPLPPGWVIAQDPQGRQYYANPLTGESSWTPPVPSVNVIPHIPSIPPPPPQEQSTFTPTLNTSNLIVPSAKALLAKHESSKSNVPLELTLTGGMIADLVSIQNETKEKESLYQEIDVEKMSPTSYIEPMVDSRLEARILGLKDALRKIQ